MLVPGTTRFAVMKLWPHDGQSMTRNAQNYGHTLFARMPATQLHVAPHQTLRLPERQRLAIQGLRA